MRLIVCTCAKMFPRWLTFRKIKTFSIFLELPPSPFNYLWQVPIIFKDNAGKMYNFLLKTKKAIFKVPRYSLLNPEHNLYYRVNYEADMITHLTDILSRNHTKLNVLDRTGLISDQFGMLKAKLTNLSTIMNLLKYFKVSICLKNTNSVYIQRHCILESALCLPVSTLVSFKNLFCLYLLKNETEHIAWAVVIEQINNIRDLLGDSPTKLTKLESFMKELTKDNVERIGWTKQNTSKNNELQIKLLKFACQLNITSVVKQSEIFYR